MLGFMSKPQAVSRRIPAAVAMGALAGALSALFLVPAGLAALALLGGAVLAVWLAARANSARSAWGSGCLINGLLSMGVAVGFRAQDDFASGRAAYSDDLDRAIGPLGHFVWALAGRAGLIAALLAAALFALSLWLLGPPHRRA
jgi:hypothetical protein